MKKTLKKIAQIGCLLAIILPGCKSSSTFTIEDFYAMPVLKAPGKRVQTQNKQEECSRHGDMYSKIDKTCFFCEKPVTDEN